MLWTLLAFSPALIEPDWKAREAPVLTHHVQLTFPEQFVRAGEAYFNPEMTWIIFQAVPRPPEGSEPGEHYEMYVAPLARDADDRIIGLGDAIQISKTGSANTCGWFHPTEPGRVLFGSTIVPPTAPDRAGYQRDTGRYRWQFPEQTQIVSGVVPAIVDASRTERTQPITAALWTRPGYDAEGSWSPDGNWILYTQVDVATGDPDIYVRRVAGGAVGPAIPLVTAAGYDGGPFFSPDGRRITYRSDRLGNNLLQLFVADLAFDDDDGSITGIEREIQLTDNAFVNWAPYWHPSGALLVYSTNEAEPEQHNYEVFAIDARGETSDPVKVRLTKADGFDGLPVFSPDGKLLMWTSQRGAMIAGESRPSSQVWLASFDMNAFAVEYATVVWQRKEAAAAEPGS